METFWRIASAWEIAWMIAQGEPVPRGIPDRQRRMEEASALIEAAKAERRQEAQPPPAEVAGPAEVVTEVEPNLGRRKNWVPVRHHGRTWVNAAQAARETGIDRRRLIRMQGTAA
jgi:hypothetical protein